MSGRILIVETTASQRIYLRGLLESAHYAVVTCDDLVDAMARITTEPPDLLLIDTAAENQAALALCAALRDAPATATLPVIALACMPGPETRLAALRAGADDILDKRGDAAFLLARIRSLLRARDATADFAIAGGAARALGMAETAQGFVPAGRTALITRRPDALPAPLATLAARLPGGAVIIDPADDFAGADNAIDLFVIDHGGPAAGPGDASSLFRLIADLQSRRTTRRAKAMVVVPDNAPSLGEMALDLGADDLVSDSTGTEEIAFRVRALLRRKNQADRQRDRVQTGLAAAVTDTLTGLFNRRYAMAELARLVEQQATHGGVFSVMILDIDHFKRINDTHGHAAGDTVLREIARLLKGCLRAGDIVARIGGEEFLVAMPDTAVESARRAAERLRAAIESARIDIGARSGTVALRVTLSAGVACGCAMPDAADPVATLFDRADRALYAAKSAGRNTVTVALSAA